jgi:hypothetical protein
MIAPKYNKPDLDYAAIEEALSKGVRDAVLTHARLGFAVPEGRNGTVVWVQPAEILAEEEKQQGSTITRESSE